MQKHGLKITSWEERVGQVYYENIGFKETADDLTSVYR
jgi:hypothetical protein